MKRRLPPFDDCHVCHHAGGLRDARLHRRLAIEQRNRRLRNLRAALLADKLDAALEHQRSINAAMTSDDD